MASPATDDNDGVESRDSGIASGFDSAFVNENVPKVEGGGAAVELDVFLSELSALGGDPNPKPTVLPNGVEFAAAPKPKDGLAVDPKLKPVDGGAAGGLGALNEKGSEVTGPVLDEFEDGPSSENGYNPDVVFDRVSFALPSASPSFLSSSFGANVDEGVETLLLGNPKLIVEGPEADESLKNGEDVFCAD